MTEKEDPRLIEERDRASSGDWDRFLEAPAESVLVYAPGMEEPLKGKEATARFFHTFSSAFPSTRPQFLHSFGGG